MASSCMPEGFENNPDWCPGAVECPPNMTEMAVGTASAYISIVSSFLSCISSILIVFTYVMWKDIRSGSRTVITFLAVTDFFTAFGYIMGSINYIVHYEYDPGTDRCVTFSMICQIQSFITSWSSVSSFIWTSALALYLYLTLVKSRIFLAQGLMPAFHVIGWGFPILFCLPLLVTGNLGFSPYAAASWCFISQKIAKNVNDHSADKDIYLYFIGGKLWELIAYAIVIVFYTLIKIHIRQQTTRNKYSKQLLSNGFVDMVKKADRKLTLIPVVFVLLRMWGTMQFFYAVGVHSHCGCVSKAIGRGFAFFGIVQAIGDGGQGWGNFILYVLASGKIRRRLFRCVFFCYNKKPPPQHDEKVERKEPSVFQQPIAKGQQKTSINYPPSVYDTHPARTRTAAGDGTPPSPFINTHEPTTDFDN